MGCNQRFNNETECAVKSGCNRLEYLVSPIVMLKDSNQPTGQDTSLLTLNSNFGKKLRYKRICINTTDITITIRVFLVIGFLASFINRVFLNLEKKLFVFLLGRGLPQLTQKLYFKLVLWSNILQGLPSSSKNDRILNLLIQI